MSSREASTGANRAARGASAFGVMLASLFAAATLTAQNPTPPSAPGAAPGSSRAAVTASDTARLASAVSERYAVPEIPAVTFLDAAPTTISRPSTPKDIAVEVLDAIDAEGRVRHGFALEVSPSTLIPGFGVTLEQYRRDRIQYALANLLVSIAAVRDGGDTNSTNIAYGVRTTLFDAGDPMRDTTFLREFGDAMLACAPQRPPPPELIPFPGQPDTMHAARARFFATRAAEQTACLEERPVEMAREYVARRWNATRLVLAFAYGEVLRESRLSERRASGSRVWAVGGLPIGTAAQLVGYLDYSHTRATDDLPSYEAFTWGGRLNAGSPRVNVFYEALGRRRSGEPAEVRERTSAWSAGIEFLATNNVWISTGLGERFQELVQPDRVVVLANIRWGISAKPWLATPP